MCWKNVKETSLFMREIQLKPEVRSRVAARVWNSNARETEAGEWPARNKQTKPYRPLNILTVQNSKSELSNTVGLVDS